MQVIYRIVERGQSVPCDYTRLEYAIARLTDEFARRGNGASLFRIERTEPRAYASIDAWKHIYGLLFPYSATCLAQTLAMGNKS